MSLTAADWEQIENYADGTLPEAAKPAVEARLMVDVTFQAALAEHRSLVTGIRAAGRADLRQQLRRLNDEMGPPLVGTPSTPATDDDTPAQALGIAGKPALPLMRVSWRARWSRIAAAASLAAVVGVGALLMMRRPDSQALATRYGLADPGLPVLMGSDVPPNRVLVNQAMNAYKMGDYDAALDKWLHLPAGSIGPDTTLYYTGIFQYSAAQPVEAAQALARVRELPASAFRERADYYFALALWAQGRNQEAEVVFTRLAEQGNHPYADAAREALPHLSE